MQKALVVKVGIVLALSLLMIALINLVGGIVSERQQRQLEVLTEISRDYSGAQRTASPMLVIPYTEEFENKDIDDKGRPRIIETKRVAHRLVYFPSDLGVEANADTDWKHRGLFRALVYEWRADEAATFNVPSALPFVREKADSRIILGTPSLVILLTDPRGLVRRPEATLDGHSLTFEAGSGTVRLEESIHSPIPLGWLQTDKPLRLSMRVSLRGPESFGFVPYGDSTRVTLKSTWPSPSFAGAFLPTPQSQQSSNSGFEANWEVSSLGASAQSDMETCVYGGACEGLNKEEAMEVHFIEPINIYSLSDRAIKYGFLFVWLIFGSFFLFEVVRNLRIHPAQYFLVGLAIAVFFLLLISLSEHLVFWIAYATAATASTLVITIYLSGVLAGVARGLGFGLGLASLFGALYILLNSEDNALMLGSLLLFTLLTGAMLLTRKLDWYGLQPEQRSA